MLFLTLKNLLDLQNAIPLYKKLSIQQHGAIKAGAFITFTADIENLITEPSVSSCLVWHSLFRLYTAKTIQCSSLHILSNHVCHAEMLCNVTCTMQFLAHFYLHEHPRPPLKKKKKLCISQPLVYTLLHHLVCQTLSTHSQFDGRHTSQTSHAYHILLAACVWK
jgi:hypothetical protein